MRIYCFVSSYPSAYRPYLDVHFGALVERGHDLRIFALGRIDEIAGRTFHRHGLRDRVDYVLDSELRHAARHLPVAAGAFLRNPVRAWRTLAGLETRDGRWRDRLKSHIRALELPAEPPDLCLVHGPRVLFLFRWLSNLYPSAPIALYYHGAEPAEWGMLPAGDVRRAFRAAHVTFTNTRASARQVIERGCPPNRVTILPMGFDLEAYRPPSREERRQGGVLRLTSIGRLTTLKGHRYALDAIQELVSEGRGRLEYVIVGDGPERSALVDRVRKLGLEGRVSFRGTLAHEEVLAWLGRADVLIHPSVTMAPSAETQAIVVQEAMLMGALVVTTSTGGVPESIPECMAEFCVPERDPKALAHALRVLYDSPSADLERLGECGRDFVRREYDVYALNDRLLEVALDSGPSHELR